MSFQRLLNISRRSMRLENKSEDGMAEGKDKGFVQCDFVEHLAWPQHLQENMQEVSDILREQVVTAFSAFPLHLPSQKEANGQSWWRPYNSPGRVP